MITVHHLEHSRSQRVLWLLEELGLPYDIVRYARDKRTMLAPAELKAIHPLGKSPVIVDDDSASGSPLVVAETAVIIDYLVQKADGALGPPAHRDATMRYNYFMHYAEGSLMPPLFVSLVLSKVPLLGKTAQRRIQPMIEVHLDFIEFELGQRPWFAGDVMTAADVMMSFPIEAARARGLIGPERPATIAWLDKLHARPAYQTALAKGGPYAYA